MCKNVQLNRLSCKMAAATFVHTTEHLLDTHSLDFSYQACFFTLLTSLTYTTKNKKILDG